MAGSLRRYASMEYDDEEKLDRMEPDIEMPDYPMGMQFRLSPDDLGKICDGECSPGAMLQFGAIGEATSVYRDMKGCRIEVCFCLMSGPDGQFVELDMPPSIALTGPEMEKLDLCEDCERGDMIHLVGVARVESISSNDFSDGVTLQIVEASVENESEENRSGEVS